MHGSHTGAQNLRKNCAYLGLNLRDGFLSLHAWGLTTHFHAGERPTMY